LDVPVGKFAPTLNPYTLRSVPGVVTPGNAVMEPASEVRIESPKDPDGFGAIGRGPCEDKGT
jgi:hypothetical protein